MGIRIDPPAVSRELDALAQSQKLRDCHEHACPRCGLSWGHNDDNCDSGEESWLVCPICQPSMDAEMAPSAEVVLDAEFGDYCPAGLSEQRIGRGDEGPSFASEGSFAPDSVPAPAAAGEITSTQGKEEEGESSAIARSSGAR
jgi:hypothetical protein